MDSKKIFADGFYFKRNATAPEWAVGKLSINLEKARQAFTHAKDGWLNLEVKQARSGNYYVEVDTWEPNPDAVHKAGIEQARAAASTPNPQEVYTADIDDDIPF
jgi:hypothetical protein